MNTTAEASPSVIGQTKQANRYLDPVRATLDTIITRGTDRYGVVHSPIWVSILDVETLDCPWGPLSLDEADRVQRRGRRAPAGSNLFLDQAMLRAAQRLSLLTGEARYEQAATDYVKYYLQHFVDSQTGLIEWGLHNFVDVYQDAVEFLEGHFHEIHVWMPSWPHLYQCDPKVIAREIESIWEWHFNHDTAQFGRHPERGYGCSFAMTGGEFIAAFAFLYRETGRPEMLEHALRAARVHWKARHRDSSLIPNQAEKEEEDSTSARFDSLTSETSISGLWCSRLLAAAQLTGNTELRDMAVTELKAFLKYQWQGTDHPWGQLNLDGTPVPGPRVPVPTGIVPDLMPYDCWAPRGKLDLWPAYMGGYEYPHETALAYVYAHRLTGDSDMLAGAQRWGKLYAAEVEPLRTRGGTYAQHYGMIISFYVELSRETGKREHLETAAKYADQAIDLLFTGRIFRGHPTKPYYEAADGVGFLCYGLLQLHEALNGASTSDKDPFAMNF